MSFYITLKQICKPHTHTINRMAVNRERVSLQIGRRESLPRGICKACIPLWSNRQLNFLSFFQVLFTYVFNYLSYFFPQFKYFLFENRIISLPLYFKNYRRYNYLTYCTTKHIFVIGQNRFIKPKPLQLGRCFGVAGLLI